MPEFRPRPQLPYGLAAELIRLTSQRPPSAQGVIGQTLLSQVESALGQQRQIAGEERAEAGQQRLKRIPVTPEIQQAAQKTGLDLSDMKDIDETIGQQIVNLHLGGQARFKYLQFISGSKTKDDLMRWRGELLRDPEIDAEAKRYQIEEIDRIMRERFKVGPIPRERFKVVPIPAAAPPAPQGAGLLDRVKGFFQGAGTPAPAKSQDSQPGLPGLKLR